MKLSGLEWRSRFVAGLVLGALGLWGCAPESTDSATGDLPRVVTTYTMLADLTERIGCDAIEHRGLLQPGADPHLYEPVPRDSLAIEQADLIFYNGYNLEPALIRLIEGDAGVARAVAVGEQIEPLLLAGQTEPDPHVWGDVANAIVMVEVIQDELSELDPSRAESFQARADLLAAELERLDDWIADSIATIPPEQRRLVTTHDAFQYFADAYDIPVLGTLIGISTEEQPSARTVARLVDSIRAAGVSTIFAETTINPQLIENVAAEANVALASPALFSDSIGAPGGPGDSYIAMMATNALTITQSLGGRADAFELSNEVEAICAP
ncbi:MAG: zinc ABC transporter substrate-binding protein [Cyanobacteria bacterium P01_E01_bin.48]